MKKTWKSRLVGGLLTAVFTVGMLPVSVFATEPTACPHEIVENGKCIAVACDKTFGYQIGTKGYDVLAEAIEAANAQDAADKAIVLWQSPAETDFTEGKLDLGDAYLEIRPFEGKGGTAGEIEFSGVTIESDHAEQVILNKGKLTLTNVTVTNTNEEGKFAVNSVGMERAGEDKADASSLYLNGGSYTAKQYAVGLKDTTAYFGAYQAPTPKDGEAPKPVMPLLDGKTADFLVDEKGYVEVQSDLKDSSFTVESVIGGMFAYISQNGDFTIKGDWFKSADNQSIYNETDKRWEIVKEAPKTSLSDAEVTLSPASAAADGNAVTVAVTVKLGEATLTPETDYDVSYKLGETTVTELKDAGEYTIVITGKGSYEGTASKAFVIEQAPVTTPLTGAVVTLDKNAFEEDGSVHIPGVTVVLNNVTLEAGKDYTLSYRLGDTVITDPKTEGTYTVVVTGTGAYTGEVTASYTITKPAPAAVTLKAEHVVLDKAEFTYNTKEQKPVVTVTVDGNALLLDTDYTLTWSAASVNAGDYKVTVTGKGGYEGIVEKTFSISPAATTLKWDKTEETITHTGNAVVLTAKAAVSAPAGDTRAIKYAYSADGVTFTDGLPVNVGTYTIKASVAAEGNYAAAEATMKLVIAQAKTKVTLELAIPQGGFRYTGSEHKPAVTVKDAQGNVIAAAEYDVAYTNNVNVGKATVTVTDKNGGAVNFDKATAQFDIQKAAAAALEITGKADTVTYGTKPLQLGVATRDTVTWEITEGGAAASIDKNGLLTIKGVGKVTVKATKAADTNAEGSSAQWSFEVKPAVLTVSGAAAKDKSYDGKNTVAITGVTLKGIVGSDDVKIDVTGLIGTLDGTAVGVYEKVKLGNLSLAGAAAKNYTLTAPADAVATKVTVKKADLPAALESIEVKLPVTSSKVEVPDLGAGMPKDAGTLKFHNRTQDTVDGNKVIVLKWGVDEKGKLSSEIASAAGGDQIIYVVAVESQNYNSAELKVVVTLGAVEIDASKLTVTPEKTELTYNGADQKPGVTVKYDGAELKSGTDFDVTYPDDSKSVGEKELKVTFKGSYTGSAAAKYTITKAKVTVSGGSVSDKTFDGTNSAAVNAGTLSGVVKGDDVKVSAKGVFTDKNSGTGKKVTVTFSLTGEDAGNYELTNPNGTLTGRIYAISANSLYNRVGTLSTANANSTKKQTLNDVVYLANLALSDGGLANSERSSINAVKSDAEVMISRIDSAAAAAATESIRATEKVTKDNVKLADQSALVKAQSDLNTALTTYSGNYTAGERKEIETDKTRVADALAVVTKADSANKLINALPKDYSTVTTVTADAVKAADEAYSGLSDYAKSLISAEQLEKLNAAKKATDGVTPTETPDEGKVNISGVDKNEADKENPDTIKFPVGIVIAAVILAAGSAGGYLYYAKKKQEYADEEEDAFFY